MKIKPITWTALTQGEQLAALQFEAWKNESKSIIEVVCTGDLGGSARYIFSPEDMEWFYEKEVDKAVESYKFGAYGFTEK